MNGGLAFTKMHALGNDFVILDAVRQPLSLSPERVRRLADRRYGVGCDQVLVLAPSVEPGIDFNYEIYNADGQAVGQCGNGARCLAHYIAAVGHSDKTTLRVKTFSRVLQLKQAADGQFSASLGVPDFSAAALPTTAPVDGAHQVSVTCVGGQVYSGGVVSLGNPHLLLRDDVQRLDRQLVGAELSQHPSFPEGVNVGFIRCEDKKTLTLHVYERGAGLTQACGSGACAAVVMGIELGLLERAVSVHMPGGAVQVSWPATEAEVVLSGPTAVTFTGTWLS